MEKEIRGAEDHSNSSDPNREVEATEKQDSEGLRSRENVSSFTGSVTINMPTTSQKVDEDTGRDFIDKVTPPITPRTPLMMSPEEEGDDDEENYKKVSSYKRLKYKRIRLLFLIEFSLFVCITLILILSKTMDKLKNREIWSLELWKWCVLALAFFCGHLFAVLFTKAVLFFVLKNFLLKWKVKYFVRTLQKKVGVFIWLSLILLSWGLLIDRGGLRSRNTDRVLNYITKGLASTLIVHGAWVIKVLTVKNLKSSFHVKRFFDRIQENIFEQYMILTLSGHPMMEFLEPTYRKEGIKLKPGYPELINISSLNKTNSAKVSAWAMKALIQVVQNSEIHTISYADNDSADAIRQGEQKSIEITSEREAQTAAYAMFRNVAQPGFTYIKDMDLCRFMKKEEAEIGFALIGGAKETGRIKKKTFTKWVVNVHMKRKFLQVSLHNTKTAIAELNKFITGITVVVLIIFWLILMGITSTEVLLFLSSQFLLAVFSFGASAKSTIEAIVFVFVKHPFDVGDRCVVDDVQVVVDDMSILTTVFRRYDNQKIYYPNAVLATKTIINFYRSPDVSDYIDFDLDVSTSSDDILALKAKIKKYIDSKPHLWRAKHNYRVREIKDSNKMKMSLYITHTINFQNYEEISHRRSKLMLKLKSIFGELGIKYHLLPQKSFDLTTTTTLLS